MRPILPQLAQETPTQSVGDGIPVGGDAVVRGTPEERQRAVTALVMDRAKARLEADRFRLLTRREPPPDDPPSTR